MAGRQSVRITRSRPGRLAIASEIALSSAYGARPRRGAPPERVDEDGDVEDALAALRTLSTPSLMPVRRDLLRHVLALLPPAAAQVIRLRFFDALDAATVAERLGIERAAVDQRVARAKRQLRDALAARPDLAEELRRGHPRLY